MPSTVLANVRLHCLSHCALGEMVGVAALQFGSVAPDVPPEAHKKTSQPGSPALIGGAMRSPAAYAVLGVHCLGVMLCAVHTTVPSVIVAPSAAGHSGSVAPVVPPAAEV